jgi:hypothetical protein
MGDPILLVPVFAALLILIWATWVLLELQAMRRELNAPRRRRGSNPSPPGRKPAAPAGPPQQPLAAQLIRHWAWEQEQVRQAWLDPRMGEPWPEDCESDQQVDATPATDCPLGHEVSESELVRRRRDRGRYGWGPRQLNPPPPAPGMRREWIWSPTQMAECGGPCWEAQDPRHCDCGALWRDVPIRMDEGRNQRGFGNNGPTTPKPPIKPQPQGTR